MKFKLAEEKQPEQFQTPKKFRAKEKPVSKSGYWSMGNEAIDLLTGGLANKLNAAGGGLIDATVGAVQGEGFNYSDAYNKHLQFQRDAQGDYNEENPIRSGIGKGAGLALGVTSMPVIGSGWAGAAKTGAAYGGVIGAGQDAESLTERAGNAALGTATGAGIGTLGYGLGNLAAKGASKVSRAWQSLNAEPETKAQILIRGMIDDAVGPNAAHVMSKNINDLGPDGMLIDALGEKGRSVARSAANVEPEARETLEAALLSRKAMQNQRLVGEVEQAAGLPVGNTKNTEVLKKEAYSKVRPQINKAYDAARKAGEDVPLDYFADVINSPVGEKVFKQAFNNQASRMATRGGGGNLAVIDETKRLLDGMASQGYRNGDPMADVYADMAKHLRSQMDALLTGNEYSMARGLRQQAYKADEAFDLGSQLGGSRIPLGLPQQAGKVDPSFKPNVAQAYAAQKAEALLNRGGTEGAMNELNTPLGREALKAALGPKAEKVMKALQREKTFNQTARAVTGNSTTARQMAEMGLSAGAPAATALAMGGDLMTGGIAGILGAVTRKGGPALARKLSTDAQRKAAPLIAQMLTQRGIPTNVKVPPPAMLEKLSTADRDKLVKMLLLMTEGGVQNTKPQTNPAR